MPVPERAIALKTMVLRLLSRSALSRKMIRLEGQYKVSMRTLRNPLMPQLPLCPPEPVQSNTVGQQADCRQSQAENLHFANVCGCIVGPSCAPGVQTFVQQRKHHVFGCVCVKNVACNLQCSTAWLVGPEHGYAGSGGHGGEVSGRPYTSI